MSMKSALQDMAIARGEPERARQVSQPATTAEIESIMLTDPTSIRAEAIRALRTRLVAQHLREGRRSLAVCAASPGVGATYISVNLAVAMAQAGIRTALVDANLRAPLIAELSSLPLDMPGLADYLGNPKVGVAEIIDTDLMPNLAVIGAGEISESPQELLSTARFRQLADQLLREFDLTIFDTPAANVCSDGQRVATVAGYSLIVSRKHVSYVNDVRALAKQLRADKSVVVGTVLNEF